MTFAVTWTAFDGSHSVQMDTVEDAFYKAAELQADSVRITVTDNHGRKLSEDDMATLIVLQKPKRKAMP